MTKAFSILDNGGTPYKVRVVSRSEVHVYPMMYEYANDKNIHPKKISKGAPIVFRGVRKILAGVDNSCDLKGYSCGSPHHGNSMLLRVGSTKYVYIGPNIYIFDAGDEIKKYFSPVGNSAVPYPYAIGTTYSFFLTYGTRLKSSLLRKPLGRSEEPGDEFWDARRPERLRQIVLRAHDRGGDPGQKMLFDFRKSALTPQKS